MKTQTHLRPRLSHSPFSLSGQGLTEYLILVLLISVVSIVAVKSLGGTIKDKIQFVRKQINEEVDLGR